MGLTNLYAKLLIVFLLFGSVCCAQTTTTTIPGKLKILTVPQSPVSGDMMVTVDASGNIKKDTIESGSTTTHSLSFTYGFLGQPYSFNGSTPIVSMVDTTKLQTILNFFPKGDTRYLKSSTASTTYALQSTTISAGTGLTGGGSLAANRTISGDTTVLRTVVNSYSLSGMQTKLNNYLLKTDTAAMLGNVVHIAKNETITGTKTFIAPLYAPAAVFNGITGTTKDVQYKNNGIIRWDLYENATTESGPNNGSDLVLNGFSDDGLTTIPAFSVKRSTGVLDFKINPTLNGSATGLEPNALHSTSTFETKTGVLQTAGFITNKSIGGTGIDRTDPQLLVNNLGDTTQHALIEIYNGRGHDEAAITFNGKLSNASNVQNGADFMRYVGDINTFNAYHVVHGFHQVGYNEDNTTLDLFSNNSVGLIDGVTSGAPWNTIARANSVRIGLSGGNAIDVNGSINIMGATTFNLPSTGKSISAIYRIDGGNDYGLIQSIDNATATYKPLTISASVITFTSPVILSAYTVATLPAGTVGMTAYVTDATAPTYLGTLTGGGTVKCPVFYDGTAWKSY